MRESKVCLTSFIYGDKYQQYIPILLYSIYKSYPEYDVVLFVYGDLSPEIKQALSRFSFFNKYRILDNTFSECNRMTPILSQSLRWVLWDDSFRNFDFIYYVDIDIIYIREPISLHEQHIMHMQTTGLCFDNLRRTAKRTINLFSVARRFKYAKFTSLWKFLFGDILEYRATGLHFIKVKEYYSHLDSEKLIKYKKDILTGNWLKYTMLPNDEALLYHILEMEGMHPEKMAIQSNSYASLSYENPTRPEFRPHHGLHLGIFRGDSSIYADILRSETYSYYIKKFKEIYLNDALFMEILSISPAFINEEIEKLKRYYEIS